MSDDFDSANDDDAYEDDIDGNRIDDVEFHPALHRLLGLELTVW